MPSLSASMGAERLSAAPKLSQHLACSDRQSSGTGSPGPQAVSKALGQELNSPSDCWIVLYTWVSCCCEEHLHP